MRYLKGGLRYLSNRTQSNPLRHSTSSRAGNKKIPRSSPSSTEGKWIFQGGKSRKSKGEVGHTGQSKKGGSDSKSRDRCKRSEVTDRPADDETRALDIHLSRISTSLIHIKTCRDIGRLCLLTATALLQNRKNKHYNTRIDPLFKKWNNSFRCKDAAAATQHSLHSR